MKSVWRHRKAGVCSTSTTARPRPISSSRVHVGEDRHAELALHLGQDLQALVDARAAERRAARAVGLVVARLEDEGDAERGGDLLQRGRRRRSAAARTRRRRGRRSGRRAARARHRSRRASWQPPHAATFSLRSAWCSSAAWMKDLNSGWPPHGRRLELGVELHADEPRVHALRQLDDLGQLARAG